MSAQKEQVPVKIVAAQFGPDEVAAIDYVAATMDPVKPNRSMALRSLVRLGYKAFLAQSQPASEPPSLNDTESPSMDVSQHTVPQDP